VGFEVWSGYSTREAAELVGLSESAIRGCIQAGILSAGASGLVVGAPPRFSFRDLRVLKVVKELRTHGVSSRRVRRELTELRRRLPVEASLAELTLAARGGHVVVSDANGGRRRSWRADNGQMLFEFVEEQQSADITPIPVRREAAPPEPAFGLTADEWLERAQEAEECDPDTAIAAYERALRLRPDCTETLVNLGRLLAETGEPERAAECFREALELDPADSTAVYNLGVVAQDAGADEDAVQLYQRALEMDPNLSEAHYNLATIYDRTGDARAAIRHINEYRKLTRDGSRE
jgi:predicted Zn-dependent protease